MDRFSKAFKTGSKIVGTSIATVIFLLASYQGGFCSGDPWYRDADSHWAYHYIYILWLEDVTDGQLSVWLDEVRAYFFPDSVCTRAQFTVLMAKTFNLSPCDPPIPSYPDVAKTYNMLPAKPAFGWIESALAAGISFTPADEPFYPDSGISREDAVEILIRSLDLYDYAHAMPDTEVQSLLGRFSDWSQTSSDRQRTMACAIKFGIIDGYEDWSLRPKNLLWRCEAATIVYRSCIIRVSANVDWFSPRGDAPHNQVTFLLSYLKNRGIDSWNMAVEDWLGNIVTTFNPSGRSGSPPAAILWDGTKPSGEIVAPGRYYYQAWVKDRSNRIFYSIKKPIDVIGYSLSGHLYPALCEDGETLTVVALTTPSADRVEGLFMNNSTKLFDPMDGCQTWMLNTVIDPTFPLGEQTVVVTATFGSLKRSISLSFSKVEPLWIIPSIAPNPAKPGQALDLRCQTSFSADSVSAEVFGASINLVRTADGWENTALVPEETEKGLYLVTFTAHSAERFITAIVELQVNTMDLSDLIITLTR